MEQLLEKDPARRPATADDVIARLAPFGTSATDETHALAPLVWSGQDGATVPLLAETALYESDLTRPFVAVEGGERTRFRLIVGAVAAALVGLVIFGIQYHSGPIPAVPASTVSVSPKSATSSPSATPSAAGAVNPSRTSPAVLTTTKTAPKPPPGHGNGHGHH